MDFLKSRRSVTAKTLTAPGPGTEALGDLLGIASRVPDHGKLVPWRFIVIGADRQSAFRDAALSRMSDLGRDANSIDKERVVLSHGVPIVAVVFSPKPSAKIPVW
ncbi:MAG: nitroreductase family protein, partial [Pseudomonadota bacterium]